jgi:hypothetical protein
LVCAPTLAFEQVTIDSRLEVVLEVRKSIEVEIE